MSVNPFFCVLLVSLVSVFTSVSASAGTIRVQKRVCEYVESESFGELTQKVYPEVSKINLYFREGKEDLLTQIANSDGFRLGQFFFVQRRMSWSDPVLFERKTNSRYVVNRRSLYEDGPYAITLTSITSKNSATSESVSETAFLRLRFFPYFNSRLDSGETWGFMVPDLLRRQISKNQVVDLVMRCDPLSAPMEVDSKAPHGSDSPY